MGLCCPAENQSRGFEHNRGTSNINMPRGTIAPNIKNFKNLRYVDDISLLYEIKEELGKGSFGSVSKCIRKSTQTQFAIKSINKRSLKSNPMLPELMMNELSILQQCSHPNIMVAVEMMEDDVNYYIVTELLEGGELFDRLIEQGNFTERKAADIVQQVALALNYMHSQNIAHRDLKPENVLLESKNRDTVEVKLADFGFSCFFDPKQGLELVLGSPLYMAPELI